MARGRFTFIVYVAMSSACYKLYNIATWGPDSERRAKCVAGRQTCAYDMETGRVVRVALGNGGS